MASGVAAGFQASDRQGRRLNHYPRSGSRLSAGPSLPRLALRFPMVFSHVGVPTRPDQALRHQLDNSLSALIDGEKKYSPPLVVTHCLGRLTGSMAPPGRLNERSGDEEETTGSTPSPLFGTES